MPRLLVPEKLVTVIATHVLENRLVASMKQRGVSGYTLQRARGAGADGVQSGMLDVDTNLQLKVILPPGRMPPCSMTSAPRSDRARPSILSWSTPAVKACRHLGGRPHRAASPRAHRPLPGLRPGVGRTLGTSLSRPAGRSV